MTNQLCEQCGAPVWINPITHKPSRWCLPCKKRRHIEQHMRWWRKVQTQRKNALAKIKTKPDEPADKCDVCGYKVPVKYITVNKGVRICRVCRLKSIPQIKPVDTFPDYCLDYEHRLRLVYHAHRWDTAERIAVEYGFKIDRVQTDLMDRLIEKHFDWEFNYE